MYPYKHSLSCQYEYGNKKILLVELKTHNSYKKCLFWRNGGNVYSSTEKVKNLKWTLGLRWRVEKGYENLLIYDKIFNISALFLFK